MSSSTNCRLESKTPCREFRLNCRSRNFFKASKYSARPGFRHSAEPLISCFPYSPSCEAQKYLKLKFERQILLAWIKRLTLKRASRPAKGKRASRRLLINARLWRVPALSARHRRDAPYRLDFLANNVTLSAQIRFRYKCAPLQYFIATRTRKPRIASVAE